MTEPKEETPREYILRTKHTILSRGRYKGSSYEDAIKDKDYIAYCRGHAKHNELKKLIEYADKVEEESKRIYDSLINR